MRVELAAAAEAEIEEATAWYLAQGLDPEHGARLAERFLDALEGAMSLVADRPQLYAEIEPGVRRAMLRGFPYSLIFAFDHASVLVLAVMHYKRIPGYWRERTR